MSIRLATPADASTLTRLINSAYRVESFFIRGDRTTEPEVQAWIAAPHSGFLVLEAPERRGLTGAVLVESPPGGGYFGLLSVDPDAQGKGFGRLLVEAAEAHCRAAGCLELRITVVNLRTELPGFYARFGYEAAGTLPFPAPHKLSQPVHLVVMRKSLV
ncbi:MAG TPA: GNAT family N-acetyltransferase [Gemmatimonadales bacterium]|nr:GNAT family N-acetyltransferase [Gemmatimonadales bacterium]